MRALGWCAMVLTWSALLACGKDSAPSASKADTSQGLTVTDAHMFAPPPGQKNGAIYLRLHNGGKSERQLVDAGAEIASSAMVHRSYYAEGIMHMRHVHHLTLAPGETLAFQPGGYHIMLTDIDSVPEVGGRFRAHMGFDQGQTVAFDVEVRAQH